MSVKKRFIKPQNLKNKVTFFIVTPSFNQDKFIKKTINSVLNQKGNFKVNYFVADGGSTDHTREILKSYPSLNYISQKDRGQTDAINKGITFFRNNYNIDQNSIFAFINSDDYYFPGALNKVAKIFNTQEIDWLIGDYRIVNSKGLIIQDNIRVYKKLLRKILNFYPSLIYMVNPIPQPSVFIKFAAINKVGLFNSKLKYTMDYDYWLRLYHHNFLPTFTADVLSCFRIHNNSKGVLSYQKQFDEELDIEKKYSNNQILSFIHYLHTQLIVNVYKIIKQ